MEQSLASDKLTLKADRDSCNSTGARRLDIQLADPLQGFLPQAPPEDLHPMLTALKAKASLPKTVDEIPPLPQEVYPQPLNADTAPSAETHLLTKLHNYMGPLTVDHHETSNPTTLPPIHDSMYLANRVPGRSGKHQICTALAGTRAGMSPTT